jgi:outer membrane protein OmpA-like peptidoglycan-associated protein
MILSSRRKFGRFSGLAVTTLLLLLVITPALAQSGKSLEHYEQGKTLYDEDENQEAIKLFKKAIDESSDYEDAWYYLGAAHWYEDEYPEAIAAFEKLESINPDHWAYYYYWWGDSLEEMGDLDGARQSYDKFLANFDKSPKRASRHHKVQFRRRYAAESPALRAAAKTMDEPVNLGKSINSKWGDYMPQSDPTGRTIYFTSDRKGGLDTEDEDGWGEDLWMIEKQGNGWSKPRLLPQPINSYSHDGAASFSGDGQLMVYSACNRDDGIGGCDIYTAELLGEQWSEPVNLGNVVNSEEWDAQPTISTDGSLLIFSSEREGGYGDSDLYMVRRNRFGEWGIPVNLGSMINTPSMESSPYLSPDGKTLYFASSGHPGFGSTDLFKTVFGNGTWSEPVNMGAPLNSSGSDRYFTIGGSGEVGYFASDRPGGSGLLDLYSIGIPEAMRPQPTVVISGTVSDAKGGQPVGAWVLVEDLKTGDLIATNKSNSVTGHYLVVLPAGRTYSVSANKDGYFFYSQKFDVPADSKYQEVQKDIALEPIEKGSKVVLNNVFFETGKALLSSDSKVELRKAVELLNDNPSMVIELGGHTDNVGDPAVNMKLSHGRAMAVRQFLIDAGVKATRVEAKGYGETSPVADNESPEGRQANRRTEIIILEF